jgi:signal transduction histidine kinase
MDPVDQRSGGSAVVDCSPRVLERLLEATRLLLPLQSEASLAQVIADSASMVFDARGAALFVVDGEDLVLTAVSGSCGTSMLGMRVARTSTAIWKAVLTRALTIVTGADNAPEGWQDQDPALAVPMSISKDVLGILWLSRLPPDTAVAHATLNIFATQSAAALDNARRCRELTQSDRSMDGEMATLAHELRSPLGAISHALRVLERLGAPGVEAIHLRELIGRQAQHLTRLVEDVLDVTRLRHGKLRLRREPVDLVELVRQTVDALQAAGCGAHHTFREAYADTPVVVAGDATRLEQVVRNLLDNAIKYSPANTAIDVSVQLAGGNAVLSIADEGIGIGSAFLPRLFEPFAQAEPAAHRGGGGLGLGLPLVRAVVEEHGGTITARSDGAGKGSRFVVRLPIRLPAPRCLASV